jgi:hypothetical protein
MPIFCIVRPVLQHAPQRLQLPTNLCMETKMQIMSIDLNLRIGVI